MLQLLDRNTELQVFLEEEVEVEVQEAILLHPLMDHLEDQEVEDQQYHHLLMELQTLVVEEVLLNQEDHPHLLHLEDQELFWLKKQDYL